MTKKTARLPLRSLLNPTVQVQYLVIPYADFRVGSLAGGEHFTFGPFELWRDTAENWPKYLGCARPSKHLAMYVAKDGTPLASMWIASVPNTQQLSSDQWQWITAALFYLAWARIPFVSIDRSAAEDFYSEMFVVPEGADPDSLTHVRWTKFGTTVWSDIKIYPALEVSTRGTAIELPLAAPPTHSPFFNPTPGELYRALEREIAKPASRLLTGLWFLHQACYRSAYRSGYAEDIQNICSAFEAILNVTKKGDSAHQVATRAKKLFRTLSPSRVERALEKRGKRERPVVLERLGEWIHALYQVRNEYTHGKPITSFAFGERSIWQDAFEIFRLAANRVILGTTERCPPHGSMLEKRLMSVRYFDAAVAFFSKKGDWLGLGKKRKGDISRFREILRKASSMDPELVESLSSLPDLRQGLFHICTKMCRTLEQVERQGLPADSAAVLAAIREAYKESRDARGRLNTDEYIRRVAPALSGWVPAIPMEGRSFLLYELVEAFKNLLSVYGNFTGVILRVPHFLKPGAEVPLQKK